MKDGLTARMVRSATFLLFLLGAGPGVRLIAQEVPPSSSRLPLLNPARGSGWT